MAGPVGEVLAIGRGLIPRRKALTSEIATHERHVFERGGDVRSASRQAGAILNHEWAFVLALVDALEAESALEGHAVTAIAVRTMRGDALRHLHLRAA